MHKEERVLKTICREKTDYLPSQIFIADRTRNSEICQALGLSSAKELDRYLENHIKMVYSLHDLPIHYRNDQDKMEDLERRGYIGLDRENGIVYDSWGCGIKQGADGFWICYYPLRGIASSSAEKYLPPSFNREVLNRDIETAIKKYRTPDSHMADNFSLIKKVLSERDTDMLVVASGYIGIFERAYGLIGFEEFMTEIAFRPSLIRELLEKITDYKIEEARMKVKLGIKLAHHGDDLATQETTLFSKKMFSEVIKPCLKRLFDVYKSAGVPIAMHSCGKITDFIPDLIDIGMDVLEPVQPCMDLAYIKKEFGKDITFWGGIDTQNLLPFGSPDEVRKQAAEVIRTMGKGGGYIIAPSQEIMKDVPIENIVALVRTIKEER